MKHITFVVVEKDGWGNLSARFVRRNGRRGALTHKTYKPRNELIAALFEIDDTEHVAHLDGDDLIVEINTSWI